MAEVTKQELKEVESKSVKDKCITLAKKGHKRSEIADALGILYQEVYTFVRTDREAFEASKSDKTSVEEHVTTGSTNRTKSRSKATR